MESDAKKWDFKQIGTGAGASVIALMLMQDRGIEFMNKHQDSSNQVVIEKTVANAHAIALTNRRLDKVEESVKDINAKLDRGFESLRNLFLSASNDRWTASQHRTFRDQLEMRLDRIERDIDKLQDKTR